MYFSGLKHRYLLKKYFSYFGWNEFIYLVKMTSFWWPWSLFIRIIFYPVSRSLIFIFPLTCNLAMMLFPLFFLLFSCSPDFSLFFHCVTSFYVFPCFFCRFFPLARFCDLGRMTNVMNLDIMIWFIVWKTMFFFGLMHLIRQHV